MKEISGLSASPWSMDAKSWLAVFKSAWKEAGSDNIGLIAAGVSFYGFLAIVPLLGAIVLSYGLVAEPSTVMRNMTQLTSVMPADAAKLIGEQLLNVVKTSDGKKGFGLLLALGLALFGARNGAGAIITALNIAYDEDETRSFVRVNLLALVITAVAVCVAMLALVAVAALGHLEGMFPNAPDALLAVGKILSYLFFTLAGAAAAATLYRFGPARSSKHWVWLTPGSALAALLWLGLTVGFGVYVANFGNYNATYGSLGAVVVLLTWLSLSTYILLFGAELNAELEKVNGAEPIPATAQSQKPSSLVTTHSQPALAATPSPVAPPHSDARRLGETYSASRAANRIGRIVGLRKVGMLTSAAATTGLMLLRRESRGLHGASLLGAAAGRGVAHARAASARLGRGANVRYRGHAVCSGPPSSPRPIGCSRRHFSTRSGDTFQPLRLLRSRDGCGREIPPRDPTALPTRRGGWRPYRSRPC